MQGKVTLLVFALAAILVSSLADDSHEYGCFEDIDCEYGDCCVQSLVQSPYGGDSKVCRDRPDDFGDVCGGPHRCPTCGDRRVCEPIVPGTVVDRVSVLGRCGRKKRRSGRRHNNFRR